MNPYKNIVLTLMIALLAGAFTPPCFADPKSEQKPSASPSTAGLLHLLKTETWEWYDNPAATKPSGQVKFLENGKLETAFHFLESWAYLGGNKFKVTKIEGTYWVFDYRAAGRQATATPAKGALAENKVLKVKR